MKIPNVLSSFCVSTSETYSGPKQAIFFSHWKRMKNESYLTQSDTNVFQNIKLVCQKAVKIPNAFSIGENTLSKTDHFLISFHTK